MENPKPRPAYPAYYGLAFLLAFALSVVMLITDKNLQTDFGTVSNGYFVHWYVILGTAVADLVGAALLLAVRSRLSVLIGVIGSALLTLLLVGAIFTYSQVGFASTTDMANYLFGITYYGGDIRYLYDALLAVYIGTFVTGVVMLVATRSKQAVSSPSEGDRPSAS